MPAAGVADLADGVKELPVRVDGQERGVGHLRREDERLQRPGGRIEPRKVDALGRLGGISAGVHIGVRGLRVHGYPLLKDIGLYHASMTSRKEAGDSAGHGLRDCISASRAL